MFDRFNLLIDTKAIDENVNGIAVLLPTAQERITMRNHQQALTDFKAVTLTLQNETTTMADSDELFQSIIQEFRAFDFAAYLGSSARKQ